MDDAKENTDTRPLAHHADTLFSRLLRRWLGGAFKHVKRRLNTACANLRAEAELRALDAHELHDLGLDRCSIAYVARHGREG